MSKHRRRRFALILAFTAIAGTAVYACGRGYDQPAAAAAPLEQHGTADEFVTFDADHDGRLSSREFSRSLAGIVTPGEAGKLFEHLDRDHDGALSRAEYFPDPGKLAN